MRKRTTRIIAMALILVFAFQVIPMTSFAEDDGMNINLEPEDVIAQLADEAPQDVELSAIVCEDTGARTENEKQFLMEDGLYLLAQYPTAVHYENENGEWTDIDNTLVYEVSANASDFDGYTNTENSFSIKFAEEAEQQLFRFNEEDYSIGMGLIDDELINSEIVVTDDETIIPTDADSVDVQNEQKMTLDNLTSEVMYNNILPGTSIEYTVLPDGVKEYIVVNSKQDSYEYSFELSLGNLSLRENSDGSISIMTTDTSTPEEKYIIPAPYMVDANGETSYDVVYNVSTGIDGSYILTVEANEEWINDADTVLPVKIDPSVTKKQTITTITDTFVSSNKPNLSYHSNNVICVGNDGDSESFGITRSYINWSIPIWFKSSYVVTKAKLKFEQINYERTNNPIIEAKCVTSAWSESTISWNNQPAFGETDLDYVTIENYESLSIVEFDITKAIIDTLNSNNSYGIVLKSTVENANVVNQARFISSAGSEGVPTIEIYYRNQKGIDDNYSFLPINCGDVGTAYINTYNGDVSYVQNTYTSSSGKTVINHTYNAYMLDAPIINDNYESFSYFNDSINVGKCWKTSAQEIIVPISESEYKGDYASGNQYSSNLEYAFVYNDMYGNNIFLVYSQYLTELHNNDDEYKHYTDEKGLNYDLTVKTEKDDSFNDIIVGYELSTISIDTNEETGNDEISIIDSKTFKVVNTEINGSARAKGFITRFIQSNGTILTYNYFDDTEYPSQLENIKVAGERKYPVLNYDDDGNLINITVSGEINASFNYSNDSDDNVILASITDAENRTTTFTYTLSGKLSTVTAGDGTKLIFNYNSSNERLVSVDWKSSTATAEELVRTSFTYDAGVTTVHYYGSDRLDSTVNTTSTDDLFVKFLFDTNGNNVAVYTQNANQVTNEAVNTKGLKGIEHTAINDPNMNYTCYAGESLISGASTFALNTNANSNYINLTSSDDAYTGSMSYKLTVANANARTVKYIKKTVDLDAGSHTFSAYVKCLDETDKTVKLYAEDYFGDGVNETDIKELKQSDSWTQLSINFTTEDVDLVDLFIKLDENDGIILIDDVTIDNQIITWPVSLNAAVSSGFEIYYQSDILWECTNSCLDRVTNNPESILEFGEPDESYCPDNVLFGNYSLAIDGSISEENSVYHIYYNNYNDIGEGFVLSGWGKADSVPTSNPEERGFELFAYYLYKVRLADGTIETRPTSTAIPFNYQNDDWQFVSQKLEAPTVNEGETMVGVYSITIGALYKGNTGTAYFDNIELTTAE